MKQLLFTFLFFLSITSGFAKFDLEKLKNKKETTETTEKQSSLTLRFTNFYGGTTSTQPCNEDLGATYLYHYFTGVYELVLNEIVYADSSGENPFNGQNLWFRDPYRDFTVQINTEGEVIAIHECIYCPNGNSPGCN
ncbi:hypothetical protein [Algibacter lectus]|uniref:hypothetical protein n=1 Tax=Algibacter lectus TaxID=221126 RepID=UPI0005A96CD9|nr:hypothetical protein [Algibacter lectus]SFB90099.1 hypothetical protein SAMN04489722_101215 [Algibacter lectus]